jgi:uncharacterized phiE125 gp8 family phage protein
MSTQLITPSVAMAVSIEDARIAIRADGDELDSEIEIAVRGITSEVEHHLQRSIINQTWRCTLDLFPEAFKLYYPPVISVSSLRYYDTDGVLQTLNPADYVLDNVRQYDPGYLVPAKGKRWPDTETDRINAVMVEYVAGYGSSPSSIPPEVKMYILAKLAVQFGVSKDSQYIDKLLERNTIWSRG